MTVRKPLVLLDGRIVEGGPGDPLVLLDGRIGELPEGDTIPGGGGGGGGDVDYTANAGIDTGVMNSVLDYSMTPIDAGADNVAGLDTVDARHDVAAGTDSGDLTTPVQTGTAEAAMGADTQAMNEIHVMFVGDELGEDSGSMAGSSVTRVIDYVDTATVSTVIGTDDEWQNEANSQGAPDGAFASINLSSGVGVPEDADSDLEMSFGAILTLPDGNRSEVDLTVRHRLDTTMGLTSSVSVTLVLSKANGSDPLTLLTSSRSTTGTYVNQRNDTVLADEVFDVTSHVSGWTETELASALLVAHMDGTAIVAGGDAVWEIDSAALSRGYQETGL